MLESGVLLLEAAECGGHSGFVDLIAGSGGNGGLDPREPEDLDLSPEDRAPDAMHADPVVVLGDGCQEGNELDRWIRPERRERETAVLTPTPRQCNRSHVLTGTGNTPQLLRLIQLTYHDVDHCPIPPGLPE